MIIAICGFMGAGKSSFLKQYPDVNSVDIDHSIELEVGPIGEFIRDRGWGDFRELETKKIKESVKTDDSDLLISLGGGALDDQENIKFLKDAGVKILFIQQDFEVCLDRIEGDKNRPQLDKSREELHELFTKREKIFREASTFALKGNSEIWPTQWTVLKTLM